MNVDYLLKAKNQTNSLDSEMAMSYQSASHPYILKNNELSCYCLRN
jgi:hypothetical protein